MTINITPSRLSMALMFRIVAKEHEMKTLVLRLCIIFVVSVNAFAQQATNEWTLDDIFASSKFQTKSLSSVKWIEGGKKYSYLETDSVTHQRNLYLYTVADGSQEMVMDGSTLVARPGDRPFRFGSYEWSSDGERILLTGTLRARRVKTGGNFGVYTVATKSFRMLTDTSVEQARLSPKDVGGQAIIKFSPDGSKIGFVRSNNLFVMDVESGQETQLTFDGSADTLNGVFDWVYEEEFAIIDGWQWSPDGKRIAFWRLDQSGEPSFPIVRYKSDDANPQVEMTRYPKAGDRNASVKIGVVDLNTRQTTWLDLGTNEDIYIPRIQWTHNPEILSVQRLNRAHDTLELLLANVIDGSTKTILTETDSAWVEVEDNLTFLEKSDQFLWTSYRDGFTHIYLYNLDGTLVRQITKGNWEVTQLVGVNEKRKIVYFIATQASPLERQLYSIKLDGTGFRRITGEAGWHSINFSPDYLVFIDDFSDVNTPHNVLLRTNDGTLIARLITNSIDMLNGYPLSEQKFFSFGTTDGQVLNGWMITPTDFDSTRKYPVLMYSYGVGGQTVTNQWGGSRFFWHQLLAQKGYIVVSVDGRGSEGRGKVFRQAGHLRLGIPESNDQIEGAKYLASLPYVDGSRIGMYGSSGGGYMTCMAMTYGADYFKAGIAIASVTDLRFYDTIWTERYMSTPQKNPEGYKETAPITHTAKFKGNLLLIHGTADDNVHWQNTIMFVNELIKQNKQVQTMFYPNRPHGIFGDNASRHLYTMMTNFLLEKL